MQEGSLRVDANVNLHIEHDAEVVATPIVEIKNMNSFRAVERAIHHEAGRQYQVWEQTGQKLGEVPKQTRGWDDTAQVTKAQRSKEEASDYRYFPDPDLVPVYVSKEQVAKMSAALPELPAALRERLSSDYKLSAYDADVLVNQGRAVVDYFLQVAEKIADGKLASNWIQQDVMRCLKEQEMTIEQFPLTTDLLAELLQTVQSGALVTSRAREVFARMLDSGENVVSAMESLGIKQVSSEALTELCQSLLEKNPQVIEDVKNGKQQAIGALIGQAKKQDPNVNPGKFREICLQLIESM